MRIMKRENLKAINRHLFILVTLKMERERLKEIVIRRNGKK